MSFNLVTGLFNAAAKKIEYSGFQNTVGVKFSQSLRKKSNVDNVGNIIEKPFDTISGVSLSLTNVSAGYVESPLTWSMTTRLIPLIGFVDVQYIDHFTLNTTISAENIEFPQKTLQLLTLPTFTHLFNRFDGDS